MVKAVTQAGAAFSVLYGGTPAGDDGESGSTERVRLTGPDRPGGSREPTESGRGFGSLAAGTQGYCCGPGGLSAAVEQLCSHSLPHALHVERFAACPSGAPCMAHPRVNSVTLARSGLELSVPADRSVLEGEIEHMDEVLTKQEKESNTVMMICCSRSRGPRIVLDL